MKSSLKIKIRSVATGFYAFLTLLALRGAHAEEPDPAGSSAGDPDKMLSLTELVPSLTPVSDYSGALLDRSTVLGDWGGLRQDLYNNGITLDATLTQVYQGVASGGLGSGGEYMGLLDYGGTLDTGKLGWWPGGLFVANAQTNWGRDILGASGVISPVNFLALYPTPDKSTTFLMEYYLTQGLPGNMMLTVGRLNASNFLDRSRFANDPRNQFQNISLNNNPLLGEFVSFSTYAALLGWQASENLTIAAAVFDSGAVPGDYGVPGGFFNEWGGGLDVGISWGDHLDGSLHLTGIWSSKDPVLFDNPRLGDDLLSGTGSISRASDNYGLVATLDQYLWKPSNLSSHPGNSKNPVSPSPGQGGVHTADFDFNERGLGVFGRFGIVPEDRNPFSIALSGGIGARGVIPGRPYDRFGIGGFWLKESDDFDRFSTLDLIGSETGLEVFYNAALTPSMQLSGSLQYIDSGLRGVENPLVLGLRLTAQF